MEETEKLFNWVTMQYAGYFKDLHTKTDKGIEENQEQGLYSESDEIELAEFYCDILKTVVLSMYPRAQKEDWYSGKNSKYKPLSEKYLKFIPKFRDIIEEIRKEVGN